jgi:hypothetical protein
LFKERKTRMKRIVLAFPAAACVALLAGCGSSSGNAALSKSFSYGAPQAPSASEQAAASSAQASLSDATAFASAPDGTKGAAVASFVDELAAAALGSSPLGIAAPAPATRTRLVTRAATSDCAIVSGNTVTFKNCTETDSGFTITLNGSISASAGSVTWDVSGGFSGTDAASGVSINLNIHDAGTIAVTSTTVKGSATSEFSGSVSAQGQHASFGLDTAAVVDMTYQTTPSYCVTSGTVEVKRVWTERPQGASGPDFADVAVKLTWSGCDAVQVAHST